MCCPPFDEGKSQKVIAKDFFIYNDGSFSSEGSRIFKYVDFDGKKITETEFGYPVCKIIADITLAEQGIHYTGSGQGDLLEVFYKLTFPSRNIETNPSQKFHFSDIVATFPLSSYSAHLGFEKIPYNQISLSDSEWESYGSYVIQRAPQVGETIYAVLKAWDNEAKEFHLFDFSYSDKIFEAYPGIQECGHENGKNFSEQKTYFNTKNFIGFYNFSQNQNHGANQTQTITGSNIMSNSYSHTKFEGGYIILAIIIGIIFGIIGMKIFQKFLK